MPRVSSPPRVRPEAQSAQLGLYSVFPYASVAILLAAFGYARYVLAHNPRAGAMEGSAG